MVTVFAPTGLLDEPACYDYLVETLYPDGLVGPRCGRRDVTVHGANRAPVYD